jgi:hypothetical protein
LPEGKPSYQVDDLDSFLTSLDNFKRHVSVLSLPAVRLLVIFLCEAFGAHV